MSSDEKKTATITWAKPSQASAKTTISFMARNKKPVVLYLVCFILIMGVGHFFIVNNREKQISNLFEGGATVAHNMGEKINSPLLEKDFLTLNVAVGELEKKSHPVFAAILDHAEKIVAHSDPDLIGNTFSLPQAVLHLQKLENVSIDRFSYKENQVIGFTKEILYSGIKIGKIVFAIDAAQLDSLANQANRFLMILWITGILGVILIIVITDIYLKKKRQRALEAFKNAETVGPYRLTRKIATGGMAELYLADYTREDGFKRTVAIKKILPHLVENQDFVDMFIREARLAAILRHPNIVQIFDLIKAHNSNFIAMEYVNGKNLAEILAHEKKGLPVDLSVFLIQKISAGLYYSHTKKNEDTGEPLNIVHRDVSPQNMLISFKGEVKISDFGISKARSEPSFTQAGVIKGKLSYLSPEQALGKETDHQSDIYALGIIFYEILSGQRLYKFNNEIEALTALPKTVVKPIIEVRKDIPEGLNEIVMKCLEKDKDKRYHSGKEINDDLSALKSRLNISYDESNLVNFMAERFLKDD
ncbi:MAG: serine/threonine protein kinase [Desulfobacter sp.]|nr:MAG: serine/threonine protein kinase [Desulfobacter sp.]